MEQAEQGTNGELTEDQLSIPGTEEKEESFEVKPWRYDVNLTLKLKPKSGIEAQIVLPILVGEYAGERVEQVLHGAIHAKGFIEKLRVLVGDPKKDPTPEELAEIEREKELAAEAEAEAKGDKPQFDINERF